MKTQQSLDDVLRDLRAAIEDVAKRQIVHEAILAEIAATMTPEQRQGVCHLLLMIRNRMGDRLDVGDDLHQAFCAGGAVRPLPAE